MQRLSREHAEALESNKMEAREQGLVARKVGRGQIMPCEPGKNFSLFQEQWEAFEGFGEGLTLLQLCIKISFVGFSVENGLEGKKEGDREIGSLLEKSRAEMKWISWCS